MGIQIQAYQAEDVPAVRAFNNRLQAGGVIEFRLPEQSRSGWLPPSPGQTLFEEYFLAKEGAEVRGGYILKHQMFEAAGERVSLGYLYSPVSEALIDSRHGAVGLQLLLNAQKRQPLLYCLGMGGLDNPLPQMLKAAGWTLRAVPFFFHIVNARAFFRNVAFLRRKTVQRVLCDVGAATGLGGLAAAFLQRIRRSGLPKDRRPEMEVVQEFGSWVDEVWGQARAGLTLSAVRDRACLNRLYPAEKTKYLKLKISLKGQPVGWCVLLDTPMSGHKHFGNLRLGSIVDGLALPGMETGVVWCATEFLRARGVDLMVTNQAHAAWVAAGLECGWLDGPSNFIFGASRQLASRLGREKAAEWRLHLTRGDGEGPTHL